jgi:signal transduction histidine kinase
MREFGVFAIILIMISSYALFFYLQERAREQIKFQLLEEQKERQLESTDAVADHIGSDLTLILSMLDGISNSKYLQDGQFYDDEIKELAAEKYSQMNTIVDKIFILNKEDIVVFGVSNSSNTLVPMGNDLSFRPWVADTHTSLEPVFSEGFEAVGEYRVFITSPVIDRETREYLGLVGASVSTVRFFEHYGNVHDINSQFLVVFDNKRVLLAVGASQSLVGLDYFGDVVQNFVNHNPILNSHTSKLLEGKSGYALYDYGRGERLTTYQPIYIAGEPTYFLQVVTPTAVVYSQIEPILSGESGKLALLLSGSTAASAVLIIFLLFWNSSLRKEVTRRTVDLQESNKLLADTNEQLKERDRLQKEFINIAAHEMRTPIQPILGLSDIVKEEMLKYEYLQSDEDGIASKQKNNQLGALLTGDDPEYAISTRSQILEMLDAISRNAKRLDKLSSNLLDVSRIENKSLTLNKEKFDLNVKIRNAIREAKSLILTKNNVEIVFEPFRESIIVEADKSRLFEVISNLINNAIKFTSRGTIIIKSEKHDGYTTVSVKDTGTGIDQEIMPRLFTKFACKSEKGMGLGLYISKSIVEAHGGKIWAENNPDGKGATFTFMLPVAMESMNS